MRYNRKMSQIHEIQAALEWHVDVGADEAIAEAPVNRLKPPAHSMQEALARIEQPQAQQAPQTSAQMNTSFQPPAPPSDDQMPLGAAEASQEARRIAAACDTLEALEEAIQNFEGCPLKRTAKNTVFAAGNPKAKIMLIGEAPDTGEDQTGKPFVNATGQLLDRMFEAIGLSRDADKPDEAIYLTNIIFWRPPGNRPPSNSELAVCQPFVERHIELAKPDLLVYAGAVSAKTLLQTGQGITKLRGKWHEFKTDRLEAPIPVMPIFHPSFLLQSPAQKKHAWADLLKIKAKLNAATD